MPTKPNSTVTQPLPLSLLVLHALFASLLPATAGASSPASLTTLSNRGIPFTVPEKPYVVLRRGPIEAVVVDNRAVDDRVLPQHRAGYHGIASLKHERQARNLFVPSYAGLNFEHIHDGAVHPNDILFEPRRAPMELRSINDHTAELYQPPTPHWGLESCMRYELLESGIVQMTFECIPRRQTWRNDYLGLFWANYIHQPESLDIHFLGRNDRNAPDGWIRGISPAHGIHATHRALNDEREFAHDPLFPMSLVFNFSEHRFAQPWYFGECRGMAYAQIFRPADQVRFSQSPSGGGNGNPAWDFQWFISHPQVGQRYQLVMRAVYFPAPARAGENDRHQFEQRQIESLRFARESDPGLPSGFGLSAKYPGDAGIEHDSTVLFAENFENGSIEEIGRRWGEISNKDGKVMSFSKDVPPSSNGRRALRMCATLPENTGGHLYAKLSRPAEKVFARFYVKFPDQAGGKFWGNSLTPAQPALVPRNRWQCVELMLQCNSAPEKSDGELALWLDGKLAAQFFPGAQRTRWTGMGFSLADEGGEPFEGFRWRTDDRLKVNFFWLLHYVTDLAARQNRVANPNPANQVWFDDVVLSTEYIGPIQPR